MERYSREGKFGLLDPRRRFTTLVFANPSRAALCDPLAISSNFMDERKLRLSAAFLFAQRHMPGERAQSDFTHMEDLGVSIAGESFPHMIFQQVLTYSNVDAARICFSESFEALAEGIEYSLWRIGGVPAQHRTDHLTAAVKQESKAGAQDWTKHYQGLMEHYGMQPTWNNTGVANENGDVEQSHRRFKEAVDQVLRVRGSREFATRSAYEHFLQDLVYKRNQTRAAVFAVEKAALRPLPATPLSPSKEVRVSRFSTIAVQANVYSVPSRLISSSVRFPTNRTVI